MNMMYMPISSFTTSVYTHVALLLLLTTISAHPLPRRPSSTPPEKANITATSNMYAVSSTCTLSINPSCTCEQATRLPSGKQEGNHEEENEPTPPRYSWVVVILILMTTIAQLNLRAIVAESRMLPKLRENIRLRDIRSFREDNQPTNPRNAHNTDTNLNINNDYISSLDGTIQTDIVSFANLYASLSKGRHRLPGRIYPVFLPMLFLIIDLLSFFSPRLDSEIYGAESLTTLRFLVAVSMMIVLLARPFQVWEIFLLFVIVGGYVSLMAISFRFMNIPDRLILITDKFVLVAFVVTLIGTVWQFTSAIRCTETHISHIVHRILSSTLQSDSRQHDRLCRMLQAVDDGTERDDLNKGYWGMMELGWWEWSVFVMAVGVEGSNLIYVARDSRELPLSLVLGGCEFMAILLVLLNDAQIEPVLFVELLRASRSGRGRQSSFDAGDDSGDSGTT